VNAKLFLNYLNTRTGKRAYLQIN